MFHTQTFDPTLHLAQLGWQQTCNSLEGGSLWYRTDFGTVLTVLFQGLSVLMYRPGQLPGRVSVLSGDLQAGGGIAYMFMFDQSALMIPRRPPWTACVHFRDSYPFDVSYLSFLFSLSAVSLGIYLCGSCQASLLIPLFFCWILDIGISSTEP